MLDAEDCRVGCEARCCTDDDAGRVDGLPDMLERGIRFHGIGEQLVGKSWVARILFRQSEKRNAVVGKHSAYFVYGTVGVGKQQYVLSFVLSYKVLQRHRGFSRAWRTD